MELPGYHNVEKIITNCCNLGTVSSTGKNTVITNGSSLTGGIAGYNNSGTIQNCINKGIVIAKAKGIGGIVGRNEGNIANCCNEGNVSSDDGGVGGIAGQNVKSILSVYNIAMQITGNNSNIGGIVGNNVQGSSSIQYAYNKAKITGEKNVGGIVGGVNNGSTVSNTYNMGVLDSTQTNYVGQIAGIVSSTSSITNSTGISETEMMGWNQSTITTNLGNFIKKTNGLPILGVTVRGFTF